MTERERFVETLLFGKPDKIPLMTGLPRESTLERWHKEGLPPGDNGYGFLLKEIGVIGEPDPATRLLGIETNKMMPEFEEKVLEHKDGHYLVRNWMGAVVEISDQLDYTDMRSAKDFITRKWHKFPVENRTGWQEIKKRYDPKTPGRYPVDFAERCRNAGNRNYTLSIEFDGPFWQLREWCGFENLCLLMAEDPLFVEEMVSFWQNFVLAVLEPALSAAPPDHVEINESMAYNGKSIISPGMARRFLLPCWQAWSARIKKSGCRLIEAYSEGYVGELIPLWIEAGINVCSPMEVAAGNDLPALRRKFGRNMAYRGGIDKRAIARGDKIMEEEMLRVIPPLLKEGGYIPSCDHGVPPDISWQNFIQYSRFIAKFCGWLK